MIRNLYYNCCPFAFSEWDWRDNIQKLCRYGNIFNGRRIVVIRTGEGMSSASSVIEEFHAKGFDNVEFRLRENDPVLQETANFIETLKSLQSLRPDEATFYAHSKGVRIADPHIVRIHSIRQWRNRMYHECLSDAALIDKVLSEYDTAGCFFLPRPKKHTTRWKSWMWCGTFFWFNHAALFSQENWADLGENLSKFSVEDFPGIRFDESRAFTLYGRETNPGELYVKARAIYRCPVCERTFEGLLKERRRIFCCKKIGPRPDLFHIPEFADIQELKTPSDPPRKRFGLAQK